MLSPSPRNPLAYLYSRKQDEVYNQQAGQHPLAQFPSTPNSNHAALYTLPVARGHPSRKESGSHLSAKSASRTSEFCSSLKTGFQVTSQIKCDHWLHNPKVGRLNFLRSQLVGNFAPPD